MRVNLDKLFFLLFTFINFTNYSIAQVDSIEQIYFERIEKFQEQDSFNAYFDEIDKLRIYYKNHYAKYKYKKKGKEIRAVKTLSLLEKYKAYREPNTNLEVQKLRKHYADLIYWIKKQKGDYTQALDIGLMATKYAVDPILLDTFSYFIERQIGLIYDRKGDESRAILYFEKCIPGIKQRKNFKRLSILYTNIGHSYKRLGQFEKAISYYELGVKTGSKIECLDCILAIKVHLRDLALARRDYKLFIKLATDDLKQLKSYKQTPKIQGRLMALYGNLAHYYYNHGQAEKALPLFQEVKKAKQANNASKINRDLAKTNLRIAQCFNSLGNKNQFRNEIGIANQYLLGNYNGILPSDSILYAESNFLDIFSVCYDFFRDEYALNSIPEYLDTALIYLQKAIKVGDLLDQKILYSDSKYSFASESKIYVNLAIETSFEKKEKNGFDSNDWIKIRNLFNFSKDLILKDKINLHGKIENLNANSKKFVDSLSRIIVSELGRNRSDKKLILDCHDKIEKVTGINMSANNQVALKDDYLEYVITSENVFLLSRMDSSMHFLKIGSRGKLDTLINTFNQELLDRNSIKKTKNILLELSDFLLPNQIVLPYTFVIIPDEKITTIPFDILLKNDKYLIEDHLSSVRTHYLQKQPEKRKKTIDLYCVNPEYTMDTDIPDKDLDRSGLYPLPFAIEEVNHLRSIFSSSFEVENISTPTTICKKLEDANVFHFTGHAKVNKDSAYLVLMDENGINKWSYDQIYHNNFNLSLVTLSACETGLGQVQYGDGLNSVARSFLGAGCDAVVYSLWAANDMSSSFITKDFYTEINKGVPINEALRKSKLKFLESADPETVHPYYWGGFVAAGDMSPVKSNHNDSIQLKILLILAILALVSFLFKTLKTKHL